MHPYAMLFVPSIDMECSLPINKRSPVLGLIYIPIRSKLYFSNIECKLVSSQIHLYPTRVIKFIGDILTSKLYLLTM